MKYRMAAALFSLAGFFVALYLYLHKLGVIGELACGISGSCEAVQSSSYATFLGISVPLIGVAGYGVLFALGLVSLERPADRRWPRLVLLLSGLAVGFTAYLTYIELFVLHAICRWCVASAVLITLTFLSAMLDLRGSAEAPAGRR
jgi:uncharacterized membrane protein